MSQFARFNEGCPCSCPRTVGSDFLTPDSPAVYRDGRLVPEPLGARLEGGRSGPRLGGAPARCPRALLGPLGAQGKGRGGTAPPPPPAAPGRSAMPARPRLTCAPARPAAAAAPPTPRAAAQVGAAARPAARPRRTHRSLARLPSGPGPGLGRGRGKGPGPRRAARPAHGLRPRRVRLRLPAAGRGRTPRGRRGGSRDRRTPRPAPVHQPGAACHWSRVPGPAPEPSRPVPPSFGWPTRPPVKGRGRAGLPGNGAEGGAGPGGPRGPRPRGAGLCQAGGQLGRGGRGSGGNSFSGKFPESGTAGGCRLGRGRCGSAQALASPRGLPCAATRGPLRGSRSGGPVRGRASGREEGQHRGRPPVLGRGAWSKAEGPPGRGSGAQGGPGPRRKPLGPPVAGG